MSPRHLARLSAALITAVLVLSATPASAHVTVSSPDASAGGFGKLVFRVPTESETAATTKIRITLPRRHAVRVRQRSAEARLEARRTEGRAGRTDHLSRNDVDRGRQHRHMDEHAMASLPASSTSSRSRPGRSRRSGRCPFPPSRPTTTAKSSRGTSRRRRVRRSQSIRLRPSQLAAADVEAAEPAASDDGAGPRHLGCGPRRSTRGPVPGAASESTTCLSSSSPLRWRPWSSSRWDPVRQRRMRRLSGPIPRTDPGSPPRRVRSR